MSSQTIVVSSDEANLTLAAVLRRHLAGQSWSQLKRLIESRHVRLNGELWLDAARRVHEGDAVEVLARPAPKPREPESIVIRYVDADVVVVEKPAGMSSVRHPAERDWTEQRKALSPALVDVVPKLLARREGRSATGSLPRLRAVHRLDKETSGLLVFARTVDAERALGRQFHRHTVVRRYLAVVPGEVEPQTIHTRLIRDRGDGRRGSTTQAELGKEAVTHVEVEERLPGYTIVSCRLETGRTHQIRIHLAEIGHAVCGEKVYNRRHSGEPIPDASGAPRLALHATELGFAHPTSREAMHWTMPLPPDLRAFVERLRSGETA